MHKVPSSMSRYSQAINESVNKIKLSDLALKHHTTFADSVVLGKHFSSHVSVLSNGISDNNAFHVGPCMYGLDQSTPIILECRFMDSSMCPVGGGGVCLIFAFLFACLFFLHTIHPDFSLPSLSSSPASPTHPRSTAPPFPFRKKLVISAEHGIT